MTTVFLWDYYKFLWKLSKPLSLNFPTQSECLKSQWKIKEIHPCTSASRVQHTRKFIKSNT